MCFTFSSWRWNLNKLSLFLYTDLSPSTFWGNLSLLETRGWFSMNVTNWWWGFFVFGRRFMREVCVFAAIREQSDWLFSASSACWCLSPGFPATHLHLLGGSACFLWCSAGGSLHRAMPRRTVWTKLCWGVCLPQQGQMWSWNWTVSVRQRFHW